MPGASLGVSFPSSICPRSLKTSRTLVWKTFPKRSRSGGVYLKTEVDKSRTKCKETDSYLFTFLTESSANHAHFDFSNLICTVFCARVILLLEKWYSVLCCKAEQDICLPWSFPGLALLSFTEQQEELAALSLCSLKQSLHRPLRSGRHCSKDLICFILAFPQSSFTNNLYFFFNLKLLFCILLVTSILLHSKSRKQFK